MSSTRTTDCSTYEIGWIKIKIAVVVGTRPEIIKMATILHEILKRREYELVFIHTGQHYDFNMSDVFIRDLGLPEPQFFLKIGSGSRSQQIARIIKRTERVLKNIKPDILLIQGDTNSALGAAFAASTLKIPIGHVEAGCRSFDKSMPEEINRVLIADLASLHFAPTQTTTQNLIREGVSTADIFLTGHPIVDLLDKMRSKIFLSEALSQNGLRSEEYYLLTIHREENVDNKNNLQNLLEASMELAGHKSIIFPIHPHTRKNIKKFKMERLLNHIIVTSPLNYFDFLKIINHAWMVLTDSGGVQQEAAILHRPCVTLRENTEWIETVDKGVNFLSGMKKDKIIKTVHFIESNYSDITSKFNKKNSIFGSLGSSKRIVDLVAEYVCYHCRT